MYFVLFQSKKNNQWYWSLKDDNNQTIAAGVQGYVDKQDAYDNLDLIQRNALLFGIYDKSRQKWLQRYKWLWRLLLNPVRRVYFIHSTIKMALSNRSGPLFTRAAKLI